MDVIRARKLYDMATLLNEFWAGGSVGEKPYNDGPTKVIREVSNLVRDTDAEIVRTKFKKNDHNEVLRDRLVKIENSLIDTILARCNPSRGNQLFDQNTITQLLGMVEQLENADCHLSMTVSRKTMVEETEELLEDVKSWEIEEYAKNALTLQLNQIIRTIHAADLYADSDLRSQVKSVIADFATEFVTMDKKYQSKLERLVQWGRRAFFGGTTLLGLTSDASAIVALLPAPK